MGKGCISSASSPSAWLLGDVNKCWLNGIVLTDSLGSGGRWHSGGRTWEGLAPAGSPHLFSLPHPSSPGIPAVWRQCTAVRSVSGLGPILIRDLGGSLKALSLSRSSAKQKAHFSSQVISSGSIAEPLPHAGVMLSILLRHFNLSSQRCLGGRFCF